MTYIARTMLSMGILFVSAFAALFWMHQPIIKIFSHNIVLNGMIFSVIFFGIAATFYLLFMISREQNWLSKLGVEFDRERFNRPTKLTILKPLSLLLDDDLLPQYISPINAKTILSSIENRLDESRVFLSYFKGVPVLLGLFGTFWGLSQTLLNLPGIIDSISSDGSSTQTAIKTLQNALNAPLSGMATAFSCSMFGLAGSLIIGFLDLQVGRVFTTFYHKIEEKLSTLTRLSSFATSSESTAEGSGPAFSMGLLEQVVEGMAALHNQLKKSEDTRLSMAKSIQFFSEKLSEMSEYMLAHQGFSQRLAQNQAELQETLLSQSKEGAQGRNEEIIKTHIRSIDATLAKLLEESIEGRNKTTNEIRQEIRVVTRTLSAIASGQENT